MTTNINYVAGRNWMMFTRKRIVRLYEAGWEPDEMACITGISENLIKYHLEKAGKIVMIRKRN